MWSLPIGPTGHFHLKNAEVDSELQFFVAVQPDNFTHFDCARVVALKIFFRFLGGKGVLARDPTETLTLPRIERYLPETLNELQVECLIESIDTKRPLGLRDRGTALCERVENF